MTAKLIQLIATDDAVLGQGTAQDPFRRSVRLYTLAGLFVASYDPAGTLSGLSPEGMVEILAPEPIEPLRPEPPFANMMESTPDPKPPSRRKSVKTRPSR